MITLSLHDIQNFFRSKHRIYDRVDLAGDCEYYPDPEREERSCHPLVMVYYSNLLKIKDATQRCEPPYEG